MLFALSVNHTATHKMSDGRKDRKADGADKRKVRADGKEGTRKEGGLQGWCHVFFGDRTVSINRWSL